MLSRALAERARDMEDLGNRDCVPCHGGVPALEDAGIESLLADLGGGWQVVDGPRLQKRYAFPDFATALTFVDRVGALAERQGHHPELLLAWGSVRVELWTHAVGGLTENDFVLAARIDRLGPDTAG